jgi:hypothetical protein
MSPIVQGQANLFEQSPFDDVELQSALSDWIPNQPLTSETALPAGAVSLLDEQVAKVKMAKYLALLRTVSESIQSHESSSLSTIHQEIQALLTSSNTLEQARTLYLSRVVPQLRDAVRTDLETVKGVCYDLFTKNDLSPATKQLFAMFEGMSTYEGTLLEDLKGCKIAIDQAPDAQKIPATHRIAVSVRDYFNWNFDPAEMGNPHQKFSGWDFFQGRLKVIAMGSPTIQGPYWPLAANTAQVDPLFFGYLSALKEKGEKHLYVSFQDATGSESARNDPLMELGENLEHRDQLIAMTCSKNSPFYEGVCHAETLDGFKRQVHEQFFGLDCTQSGCFIPKRLGLEEKSLKIVSLLADLLLSETPSLVERKALIDFYYALMISCSAYETKVNYMNFTCKDAIDRGMEALAEFCLLWFSVKNVDMNASRIKDAFREILFSRAYWVRKRSILPIRFDRFISNAEVWEEKWKDEGKREVFLQGIKDLIPIEVEDVATIY